MNRELARLLISAVFGAVMASLWWAATRWRGAMWIPAGVISGILLLISLVLLFATALP